MLMALLAHAGGVALGVARSGRRKVESAIDFLWSALFLLLQTTVFAGLWPGLGCDLFFGRNGPRSVGRVEGRFLGRESVLSLLRLNPASMRRQVAFSSTRVFTFENASNALYS